MLQPTIHLPRQKTTENEGITIQRNNEIEKNTLFFFEVIRIINRIRKE